MSSKKTLNVGMIGYAFMGIAHSSAWRSAPSFFDLPYDIVLHTIAGRNETEREKTAKKFSWKNQSSNWQDVVANPEIDVIDICVPGNLHAEIAIAALENGKHVMCEKPLANSVAEAITMTRVAQDATEKGVHSMCGYTYRRLPAITLAKQLIDEGKIGKIRQIRAKYLQDWLSDSSAPMSWRLDKNLAGSGALGDIGAHIIDACQFITSEKITALSGMLKTFTTKRPSAAGYSGLSGGDIEQDSTNETKLEDVSVDDAALFIAEFGSEITGIFEATRVAMGNKNTIQIEISGEDGAIQFDFNDMNFLNYFSRKDPALTQGFRKINVTDTVHPYTKNWWPAGHFLGYEHGFVHQVVDFVNDLSTNTPPTPSFADALQVQLALEAVEQSSSMSLYRVPEASTVLAVERSE